MTKSDRMTREMTSSSDLHTFAHYTRAKVTLSMDRSS